MQNNNISLIDHSASGGLLEEYDFNEVITTDHRLIGYSLFNESYIPAGSGIFTTLHFDADSSSLWPVCFINQSATGGISIDPLQDCYYAGCTDMNQCNYLLLHKIYTFVLCH